MSGRILSLLHPIRSFRFWFEPRFDPFSVQTVCTLPWFFDTARAGTACPVGRIHPVAALQKIATNQGMSKHALVVVEEGRGCICYLVSIVDAWYVFQLIFGVIDCDRTGRGTVIRWCISHVMNCNRHNTLSRWCSSAHLLCSRVHDLLHASHSGVISVASDARSGWRGGMAKRLGG